MNEKGEAGCGGGAGGEGMNAAEQAMVGLGWDEGWSRAFAEYGAAGMEPARVVCELRRHFYAVMTVDGERLGECTGKYHHQAKVPADYPSVGDWVAVKGREGSERREIHGLLARRSRFARRSAGEEESQQIVAANVDTVFLVTGLDLNYNPARIQRFLVAARDSGAAPVILLNKSDLCEDAEEVKREVETLIPGVPVLVTSTKTRRGLKALRGLCLPGKTLALVGSSGAGKSTLINLLARDELLPTGEVREKDGKGRHTTTRRELIQSPTGALVIDTPGMRELQLWDADEGIEEAFADIGQLALGCRFSNCQHREEPGCVVREAVKGGVLPVERLEAYRKLKREQAEAKPRQMKPSALASKPGWRRRAAETPVFRARQHEE